MCSNGSSEIPSGPYTEYSRQRSKSEKLGMAACLPGSRCLVPRAHTTMSISVRIVRVSEIKAQALSPSDFQHLSALPLFLGEIPRFAEYRKSSSSPGRSAAATRSDSPAAALALKSKWCFLGSEVEGV